MAAPTTISQLFPNYTDPGKQLVDPTQFYQAIQLLLGYQQLVVTATSPGPLLTVAVTMMTSPAGAGPFNVQLPVALAGLRLVIINLGSGPVAFNPSYNPALGRYDQIVGTSIPTGNVFSAIAYQPGSWYCAAVTTGLPPGDEPVIEPPEC